MRILSIIALVFVFVPTGFAAEEISTEINTVEFETESPYTFEPGITYSSINLNESPFVSIGLTARVASWLRLGLEQDIPMVTEDDPSQIFMSRGFARIMLIDAESKISLQGGLMFGLVDSGIDTSNLFGGLEGGINFTRKVSSRWSVGGRAGILIANYSIPNNAVFGSDESINAFGRFSVATSYMF